MKKILLLITATILMMTGCQQSSSASPQTFAEWTKAELTYPEWAEASEYTLEADNPYGPRGARFYTDIEEAKSAFKSTRYLVENLSFTDDYPMYNMWKFNLANDALVHNLPGVAYKIADEFANLEEGTVVMKYKRGDKETIYTIDDRGYRELANTIKFKAMVMKGFVEEAKTFYQENDLSSIHSGYISMAWVLKNIDMDDEANALLERSLITENLDDHPWQIASNVLGATAFYYVNGDYEKAINTAHIILDEGIDSTNEAIFMGRDRSKGYFNNHWTSCFMLIERYEQLAKEALNGKVIDVTKLEDGVYTKTNTGYILTPIDVTLTILDGKISAIDAKQLTEPADDRSATAHTSMPKRIMDQNSIKVDVMSSATISSESIRLSTIEALLDALKK